MNIIKWLIGFYALDGMVATMATFVYLSFGVIFSIFIPTTLPPVYQSSDINLPLDYSGLLSPYKSRIRPLEINVSYYGCGDGFNSRVRADGGTYDENEYTAAHVALPFGTVVRLINPSFGNFLWQDVVVNDSGPFDANQLAHRKLVPHLTRQLDVSCQTAKKLGFMEDGVSKLYVLQVPGEPIITRRDLYSDSVIASGLRFSDSAE